MVEDDALRAEELAGGVVPARSRDRDRGGAGERLQHRLQPPPCRSQPLRHLRRAGQPATAAGMEGDIERHGNGGQGTVMAEQQGAILPADRLKYSDDSW